jgi:hypothetical protein
MEGWEFLSFGGVGDCKIDKSLGGLSEFSPSIYV